MTTTTTTATYMAEQLRADLERLMPGCTVYVSTYTDGLAAKAIHRTTGKQLCLSLLDGGEWTVFYGAGNSTTGSSAYGFDSAVIHGYRHYLDFTSDHGPGTAWDYAQKAVAR